LACGMKVPVKPKQSNIKKNANNLRIPIPS